MPPTRKRTTSCWSTTSTEEKGPMHNNSKMPFNSDLKFQRKISLLNQFQVVMHSSISPQWAGNSFSLRSLHQRSGVESSASLSLLLTSDWSLQLLENSQLFWGVCLELMTQSQLLLLSHLEHPCRIPSLLWQLQGNLSMQIQLSETLLALIR